MYGSADAFAGQEARVFQSKGKYYAESGRGSLSLPKKKGQLTPSGNPFSDFEKNWYIQQGFGDPTKLVQGGNTYYYQGVSPEARQLYLIATGGKDPLTINGAQYGPNQTLVSGSAGTGYQQTQLSSTNTAPSLQDPNQGRSGLLIRRAG